MKKFSKSLILALAAAAALATGCKTAHEGALLPANTQKFDQEGSANFVLLDSGAQRSVTSPGIQRTTLPDGRLRVLANVRNRENRRIQVQINCVFKDDQGFPTGDQTAWQTLFLDENVTEGVEFVSINDKAKNFTVRVRQAR